MSHIIEQRSYKPLLLFVDLCIIFIGYAVAFHLRYSQIDQKNWDSFLALSPWILLIGLFFLSVYELYSVHRKSIWDIFRSLLVAVTFMAFLTMAASFLFREFALPRSVILIASLLILVLLLAWKIIFMKLTDQKQDGPVLLIGEEEETEKLLSQIHSPLLKGTKVRVVHPNTARSRIYELIRGVEYVFLCPSVPKETKSRFIYYSMKHGKIVHIIPSLYELLLSRSVITSIDDTMVLGVKPFGLSWEQEWAKRLVDLLVSTAALLVLLPLMLCISIAIKVEDSKGKIFYSQKRIGKGNKEFTIYKFRSMIEGAEDQTGPVLAEENDDRITRVGRLMRATRIDELPQLFNVLKGDMSIVGPRPEREFFIKELEKQHESYPYRSTVKPGITGYAQIMGKYSTDVEDKLRFDLYYIRNYSFWLDLIIILRTFIVLLDRSKAEGEQKKKRVPGTSHTGDTSTYI